MSRPLVSGSSTDLIEEYWTSAGEKKEKKNPTEEFKKYCEELPWMPECREYDV
jgi:hypothetical protein